MKENIKFGQVWARHQVAIKAMAIVVVSLILILVALLPLFETAGSTLKKINNRQAEADALEAKVSILTRIDQEILKIRAETIKRALPETKDIVVYLSAIDGLSRELGLSFGGVTISPGEISASEPTQANAKNKKSSRSKRENTKLNILDTDIKITGDKRGIYAFLRSVEETLPLMQISNVSIANLGGEQYSMTLSLGMLWAPYQEVDLKGKISLFTEKEEGFFQKLATFKVYSNPVAEINPSLGGKTNLFENF